MQVAVLGETLSAENYWQGLCNEETQEGRDGQKGTGITPALAVPSCYMQALSVC